MAASGVGLGNFWGVLRLLLSIGDIFCLLSFFLTFSSICGHALGKQTGVFFLAEFYPNALRSGAATIFRIMRAGWMTIHHEFAGGRLDIVVSWQCVVALVYMVYNAWSGELPLRSHFRHIECRWRRCHKISEVGVNYYHIGNGWSSFKPMRTSSWRVPGTRRHRIFPSFDFTSTYYILEPSH